MRPPGTWCPPNPQPELEKKIDPDSISAKMSKADFIDEPFSRSDTDVQVPEESTGKEPYAGDEPLVSYFAILLKRLRHFLYDKDCNRRVLIWRTTRCRSATYTDF
jgi:hypothetical protein